MKKNLIFLLILLNTYCFATTYNRGKLSDYEAEHLKYQQNQGWTEEEIKSGKISKDYNNNFITEACRTLKEFDCIQNPIKILSVQQDDYIWIKKNDNKLETLTQEEYQTLKENWYPNEEI